jgi:hypothetical protein
MTIRLGGTGRAFADRVKGLWGDSVDPGTWIPAPAQTTRPFGTLRLPAAMPPAGTVNRADVALDASLAAHSQSVTAGPPKSRKGEATRQAELSAWEDEGGATACVK